MPYILPAFLQMSNTNPQQNNTKKILNIFDFFVLSYTLDFIKVYIYVCNAVAICNQSSAYACKDYGVQ